MADSTVGEEVDDIDEAITNGQLVITDGVTELLNIAITIKSFRHHYDTVGNIRATIDCVEYMFVTETAVPKVDNSGVFGETSVKYGTETVNIKSANVDGYNLIKVRDMLNLLGISIDWNPEKKRVIADEKLFDVYTEIYDGCAYLFVRNIAEQVGKNIE